MSGWSDGWAGWPTGMSHVPRLCLCCLLPTPRNHPPTQPPTFAPHPTPPSACLPGHCQGAAAGQPAAPSGLRVQRRLHWCAKGRGSRLKRCMPPLSAPACMAAGWVRPAVHPLLRRGCVAGRSTVWPLHTFLPGCPWPGLQSAPSCARATKASWGRSSTGGLGRALLVLWLGLQVVAHPASRRAGRQSALLLHTPHASGDAHSHLCCPVLCTAVCVMFPIFMHSTRWARS